MTALPQAERSEALRRALANGSPDVRYAWLLAAARSVLRAYDGPASGDLDTAMDELRDAASAATGA